VLYLPKIQTAGEAALWNDMLDALEASMARLDEETERTRRFLAEAAHQLRTPIAGIRASVELLLHDPGPRTREQALMHTVQASARAGRLISSLLQMARLDQGLPPRRVRTDVVALCRGEVQRARELAPHLIVEFDVDGGCRRSLAIDPDEVAGAVANLVDNARRHARSRVSVSVRPTDGSVEIRVDDDGPGLAPGTQDRVFERFASLDGQGGSGLGLPIARAVAQAHGGDVHYHQGGFVLRLPVREE
jgi:signal transduction histidine kinase